MRSPMGEKLTNLRLAHLRRMALIVEEDGSSNPANVSLFGANTVMSRADGGSHAMEQLGRQRLQWLRDAHPLSSLSHENPQPSLLGPRKDERSLAGW
jgi:hypothetical protein